MLSEFRAAETAGAAAVHSTGAARDKAARQASLLVRTLCLYSSLPYHAALLMLCIKVPQQQL